MDVFSIFVFIDTIELHKQIVRSHWIFFNSEKQSIVEQSIVVEWT